ncbi:hypothetical protein HK097_005909, partial [Rhizophlyctis rosea]
MVTSLAVRQVCARRLQTPRAFITPVRTFGCKTKKAATPKPPKADEPLDPLNCCVAGTAAPPQRHALICTGQSDWASHADNDPYPISLLTSLKRTQTKLSLSSLPSLPTTPPTTHDILLFPSFTRFPAVDPSQFHSLARRIVFGDVHPPPESWEGEVKMEEERVFL